MLRTMGILLQIVKIASVCTSATNLVTAFRTPRFLVLPCVYYTEQNWHVKFLRKENVSWHVRSPLHSGTAVTVPNAGPFALSLSGRGFLKRISAHGDTVAIDCRTDVMELQWFRLQPWSSRVLTERVRQPRHEGLPLLLLHGRPPRAPLCIMVRRHPVQRHGLLAITSVGNLCVL